VSAAEWCATISALLAADARPVIKFIALNINHWLELMDNIFM